MPDRLVLDGPIGRPAAKYFAGLLLALAAGMLPAWPVRALERLRLPVLVVHHEQDGCMHCRYADLPALTGKLQMPRKEVQTYTGGVSVGDPCEARAHHGFNGLETQVVPAIARWMLGG